MGVGLHSQALLEKLQDSGIGRAEWSRKVMTQKTLDSLPGALADPKRT